MRERAEGRREFWAACHSFYKVDPPSPNVKRTRSRGDRGEIERGGFLEENPNPSREYHHRSLARASIRNDPHFRSHGDGLQDGDGGDGREGGVPALVHGDEVEEGAPLRGVQDRRAVARRAGGQGWRARGRVRGARRRAARRRLPLRRLRLRLRHRRQLPEEQDLLHRLVTGGVEDQGQDPVRDVEARPAAAAGRGPLRGAGHRPLRDGLRRHQRPRAMRPALRALCSYLLLPLCDSACVRGCVIGRMLIGVGVLP